MYIQVSHEPLRASIASALDYFLQLTCTGFSTTIGHNISDFFFFFLFCSISDLHASPCYYFPPLLCACCLLATGSRADRYRIVDFGGFCTNLVLIETRPNRRECWQGYCKCVAGVRSHSVSRLIGLLGQGCTCPAMVYFLALAQF